MKKILVMALVLCIASVASAGLIFQDETVVALPGETVTVTIIQEAGNVAGAGGAFTVNFDGVAVAGSAKGIPGPAVPMGGWAWLLAGTMDFTDADTAYFQAAASPGVGTPGVGSELGLPAYGLGAPYTSTLTFQFVSNGNQVLTIDGTWDGEVSTSTMTIVPEPMTMALLGLGGLFIRRRK